MLLGRDLERQQIGQVLAQARSGVSVTLALVGEPGIGKTALLGYAAEHASGMQLLRARGIESEAQIPFGSLLELIRPALTMLEKIPQPQAAALEGALALRPGASHDRFAVGAATLSMLAAYAEQAPVALLVDDAQWLDGSSAQAMLFAFRRLVADPIAVFIASREDEPSLLDGADLQTMRIGGLTSGEAAMLVPGLAPELATRLHQAAAGNPLALIELAPDAHELALVPEGAPVLVSARISRAFLRRADLLDHATRRALVLSAASDTGDLPTLERAAARSGTDLSALAAAEGAGLVRLHAGVVEFRHPLARSAIYADAPASERRDAHRALASALPDRDIDRRAWHLAAAAVGADEAASAALEQAGVRGRDRSAYATAAVAFERSGRLTADGERRARLLRESAEAAWLAGFTDRAIALLGQARESTGDPMTLVEIDALSGRIATRCGRVMSGHAILTAAAERADPERAVAMLAEAAFACFYAGDPAQMLSTAERTQAALPADPSPRARFLAVITAGMARILGGDAADGAKEVHQAVTLAESSADLRDDLRLLPWLALGPIFLRQTGAGRPLLEHALRTARARAAVGALPFVLNLIARDQACTDRWTAAAATYQEAIELARESGQQAELTFGLAGLAWLAARRGRERECRVCATEAISLCHQLGTGIYEIWATAALGDLELGGGDAARAELHERTPDAFEAARTRLVYGERLRRARNRVLAREQLRTAADTFERLGARPWADRARTELAATGETRRQRDPSTIDELTPQELKIALLLTTGRTTRETAAALFLSPKTVEYHLRHVYQKLGIHSRDDLGQALATQARQESG